jgi:hypothetical protein
MKKVVACVFSGLLVIGAFAQQQVQPPVGSQGEKPEINVDAIKDAVNFDSLRQACQSKFDSLKETHMTKVEDTTKAALEIRKMQARAVHDSLWNLAEKGKISKDSLMSAIAAKREENRAKLDDSSIVSDSARTKVEKARKDINDKIERVKETKGVEIAAGNIGDMLTKLEAAKAEATDEAVIARIEAKIAKLTELKAKLDAKIAETSK